MNMIDILEIMRFISAKFVEPIYFSLFLIIGKDLKNKRLLLTCIMIFEYYMLTEIIYFNVWFQFIYTFIVFVDLKFLYKEKAQITDIFLFAASSIILIISSIVIYLAILFTIKNYYIVILLNRTFIFSFIYFNRKNIRNLYKKFYSYWNRHNNPKALKSITLRNISVIIFNLMFYVINLCMICVDFIRQK